MLHRRMIILLIPSIGKDLGHAALQPAGIVNGCPELLGQIQGVETERWYLDLAVLPRSGHCGREKYHCNDQGVISS